jgi:hypothetical protein
VDLDSGERQNVKAILISGVLIVPTIVPPSGLCDLNGIGWLSIFDYKTGGAVDVSKSKVVSTQVSSPIAGLFITFPPPLPGESGPGSATPIPDLSCVGCPPPPQTPIILKPTGGFLNKRAIWRELIPQ